jgi:uncharacterized protein (DUF427 family)
MNHYVSFGSQGTNDRPWSTWFETPTLVVSEEADPQVLNRTGSGNNVGAWGYVCPILKDTSTGDVLEYCLQEWRSKYNSPEWANERIGTCAGAGNTAIDTIQSYFWPGTQFATEYSGSANTFVFEGNGPRHFEAGITRGDLENAINIDNATCKRASSTNPANYALVGVEHGLEGWRELALLGGSTGNLQLRTEYTAKPSTAPKFDVNGDSRPDLAWYYAGTEDLQVLFGDGNSFNGGISHKPAGAPTWAGVGDVNGDGKPDMVWYYASTHEVQVLFGDGNSFNGGFSSKTVGNLTWAALANVNGDGKADLILYYAETHEIQVLFSDGNSFNGGISRKTAAQPTWAGVADVNGDGKPDLVWYYAETQDLQVLFGDGNSFNGGISHKTAAKPNWAGIADVNGDGKPDLVWYYAETQDLQVLFGDGSSFNGGISHKTAAKPYWAGIADVNGDGKPDLVWYYAETQDLQVLFGDGSSFNGGISHKTAGKPDMALPGSFADTMSGLRPGA